MEMHCKKFVYAMPRVAENRLSRKVVKLAWIHHELHQIAFSFFHQIFLPSTIRNVSSASPPKLVRFP